MAVAGTFFALLALLTLGASAALLWPAARSATLASAYGVGAAAAVTGVATLGSLYYSEVVGFQPCVLCWVQRIFMYSLATILTVATVREVRTPGAGRDVWPFAVPLAAIGLAVSVWHWLVQHAPLPAGSCDPSNPCSAIYVERFGVVTIPFMAGCAFLFVLATAVAVRRAGTREGIHERAPDDELSSLPS